MVRIGNAVANSKGKATGDALGNQNGKELRIQDYYNNATKPWTHVIRAKKSSVAEKIAVAMEQACANMCIGYSQVSVERVTLYNLAKKKKWDISKVDIDCACDCSSLVSVCVNASGIEVSKDMYTGNELNLLERTGQFEVFTDAKHIANSKYLKRGDILLKSGHTAIVLDDGAGTMAEASKPSYFAQYKGKSVSFVDGLSVIGEESSFSYRKKIAKANGITLYIGTASQNTKLLNLLKQGKLIKP